MFKQPVGASAGLALNQTNLRMHQIFGAADSQRIAGRDDDSLLPGRKVDEEHCPIRQRPPNKGHVEFLGRLVTQVEAGDVYFASGESLECRNA
jgi:hypothetical protein